MDGETLAFSAEFDAVFSNAALHWMQSPDAAIDGMWRALKPGGRLIGEMGRAGNVARIKAALEAALARRGLDGQAATPWYFPDTEEYRAKLQARGFEVISIELLARPTPLPGGIGDWLDTFAESFLMLVPMENRAAFVDEIAAELEPSLYDVRGGKWIADYVRLRFAARKPASN